MKNKNNLMYTWLIAFWLNGLRGSLETRGTRDRILTFPNIPICTEVLYKLHCINKSESRPANHKGSRNCVICSLYLWSLLPKKCPGSRFRKTRKFYYPNWIINLSFPAWLTCALWSLTLWVKSWKSNLW